MSIHITSIDKKENFEDIKHSINIIDLVKEKDIINGHLCKEKGKNMKGETFLVLENSDDYIETIYNNEIETILTKEQFETYKYKINREE